MNAFRLSRSRKSQGGFTLAELLIVVIILAILAAIVIPQLGASTDDAKESALDATLARMRTAIDLYYQQHGHYPGDAASATVDVLCTGTDGSGTVADVANRKTSMGEQMTMYTKANGEACSLKVGTFVYGPYIKVAGFGASALPKNAISGSNAVNLVTTGDLNMGVVASVKDGWKYDTTTGKFIADYDGYHTR